MIKRILVVFIDNYSPISIHIIPISQLGFKQILLIQNSMDNEKERQKNELVQFLDTCNTDYQIIDVPALSYINSLIILGNESIFLNHKEDRIYYINMATKLIPGMLAFIDVCNIINCKYCAIYLPQDGSGNWLRKELFVFSPFLARRSLLNQDHLRFLKLLKDSQYENLEGFKIEFIMQILKELNPENLLKKTFDILTPATRKRIYDFIAPLISSRILIRIRGKYSLYILNYENSLWEEESE